MSERGFTLVELVVALFIFALLATAGMALLSVSIKSQQAVMASIDKGAESGRIVSLLSTDLAQAASRPVPAFVGRDGIADGVFLAYVRNDNAGAQRVEWRREGRRLIRTSATTLDGGTNVRTSVLAENVAQLQMRYRYKGEWRPDWSPSRFDALPQAVEIELAQGSASPLRASFLAGVGLP
jgi:general secretion pathway protein J